MQKGKPILVDATYAMLLRNDAASLHAYCVRSGRETAELFDVYAQASLTTGCLDAWKLLLDGEDRSARQIIATQPAIQLDEILRTIAERQFSMNSIQARAGALRILNWVEGGCLGKSPYKDDIVRDPVWTVPAPLKERLITLRERRFGWIVCPESGESTQPEPRAVCTTDRDTGWVSITYPDVPVTDYTHVLVSEEQLARYRQNLSWSRVMA